MFVNWHVSVEDLWKFARILPCGKLRLTVCTVPDLLGHDIKFSVQVLSLYNKNKLKLQI